MLELAERVSRPARDHGVELALVGAGISSLRYVGLADLVALKLYAGSRRDIADVVELLRSNPDANLEQIRAIAAKYEYAELIETLIREALPD